MQIGTTSPNSTLQVNGNIVGTTKNFQIPHPLGTKNWLVHSTIEGPEIAVYYRGEGQLTNGTTIILDSLKTHGFSRAMKHNESGIPSSNKPTTLVVGYKEDVITLPAYFEALVRKENRTVILDSLKTHGFSRAMKHNESGIPSSNKPTT
ncbi:MAG: hypothetical protein WC613_05960 [Candidatus Aenigmatarchaeota archaeon]